MKKAVTDLFDESAQTVEDVIKNCTQLIERDAMVAGAGNRMRNPILSVFLGTNAMEHIQEIQSTYFSCWSAQAKRLKVLQGVYTVKDIENALVQASTTDGLYQTKTKLRVVWYWDIMDDDFEDQFACVRQDFSAPVGAQVMKTFFLFCSQKESESQVRTEQRLNRLIEWSRERNYALIVLSDATKEGLLDARGIGENYHLAASLVLMLNSVTSSALDERDIGIDLEFNIEQKPVWTASYRACGKRFFDIIGVSLIKIIEKYQEMGRAGQRNNTAQTRLCGDGGDYIDFLDDVFKKVIVSRCPDEQEIAFWGDLPYSADIAALERMLGGEDVRPMGGLKALFSRGKRSADPANAIASVQDFWDGCIRKYYVGPVRKWLDSDEGVQAVTDYMYSKMTAVLTLNDMKTQLPGEWAKLEKEAKYQKLMLEYPRPESGISLQAHLHRCACTQLKREVYSMLLLWLNNIMKQLHQYADGFAPLLNSVANSLKGIEMDENVKRAYGNHMERLAQEHQDVLNRKIRPCASEKELLRQLEMAFEELVKCDTSRAYYYTLQEDMDFQIRAGAAAAANDIISSCFAFNMAQAGRLHTFDAEDGYLYCIMNDTLRGLIDNEENHRIGKKFIVNRCDRIERLYLYPVDPSTIQYR